MKLSRKGQLGLVAGLGLVLVATLGYSSVSKSDEEHQRFYDTGSMVNGFLGDYARALKKAKKSGLADVERLYAADYASPGRGEWGLEPAEGIRNIEVLELVEKDDKDYGKADMMGELTRYVDDLASIDRVKFKINLMELERTIPDLRAVLTVKFILDGVDHQGRLLQDRFFYRWTLINQDAPEGIDWKLQHDELVEGVRVISEDRSFVDVEAAVAGIDYKHERDPHVDPAQVDMRFQVIQHAFGGVSAVDYNDDDRPDLFFADGKRSRLYRNEGDRRFTDVTEEAGLDGIGRVSMGLFGDMDNDGHEDLVVVRYMAPIMYFHNQGDGTFVDRTEAMELDVVVPAVSATLLDYDNDGFLDVYLGVYGNAYEEIPRLFFFAQNGDANRLLRNDGGQRFVDKTEESGVGDTGWTLAVAAGDFDGNGYVDLATSNDFGRKNLYRNQGDGTFVEMAKEAGVLDFSGGMGVTFGDFNDDGYLDIYTSNINSNQRWFGEQATVTKYLRSVILTKWALLDLGEYLDMYNLVGSDWKELGKMVGEGNSLFQNEKDGTFRELKDSQTNRAGWGWSVAFFDADNDSDLDLYAANGWITNTPGTDL